MSAAHLLAETKFSKAKLLHQLHPPQIVGASVHIRFDSFHYGHIPILYDTSKHGGIFSTATNL